MTELGHLLTIDRAFETLGWSSFLRPQAYLGAIAPDAHRATYHVDYRDLHFRSGRRIGRRLIDFLRRYLRPNLADTASEAQAFFAGWLCHICGDELWRHMIKQDLAPVWQEILEGSLEQSHTLRQQFYAECDLMDWQLYQTHQEKVEEIRWQLTQAVPRYAVPPLEVGDIYRWKARVIGELLPPTKVSTAEPRMLSEEFVERCIEAAVEETLSMLNWEIKLLQKDNV